MFLGNLLYRTGYAVRRFGAWLIDLGDCASGYDNYSVGSGDREL
jgi:hypothetical protein